MFDSRIFEEEWKQVAKEWDENSIDEKVTDAIDRDELLDWLTNCDDTYNIDGKDYINKYKLWGYIRNAKPAMPELPKTEFKKNLYGNCVCEVCKTEYGSGILDVLEINYCPNCGAKRTKSSSNGR